MSDKFDSILVLLRSETEANLLLPIASRLSVLLGARLVLLTSENKELVDYLSNWELRHRPVERLVKKRSDGDFVAAMVQASEEQRIKLILAMHSVAEMERIVTQSKVPLLLVPPSYQDHPWSSILVPMSGEIRKNTALELAIDLAESLDIAVDVIHVAGEHTDTHHKRAVVKRAIDQPGREFPRLIELFIAEAVPFTSVQARRRVRGFSLCRGDAKAAIISTTEHRRSSLITVEWKGIYIEGRAQVLKAILREGRTPVLLVRESTEGEMRLSAGRARRA
jgi:hypothetical protein